MSHCEGTLLSCLHHLAKEFLFQVNSPSSWPILARVVRLHASSHFAGDVKKHGQIMIVARDTLFVLQICVTMRTLPPHLKPRPSKKERKRPGLAFVSTEYL